MELHKFNFDRDGIDVTIYYFFSFPHREFYIYGPRLSSEEYVSVLSHGSASVYPQYARFLRHYVSTSYITFDKQPTLEDVMHAVLYHDGRESRMSDINVPDVGRMTDTEFNQWYYKQEWN